MRPWQTIGRVETREGPLELRRRSDRDWLITIAGRVLMTSVAHGSEDALAHACCAAIAGRPRPRVLLGGLGMGFTLRAALDRLPKDARVTAVELTAAVADWCRGPLATLTASAARDPRVTVEIADVARTIAASPPGHWDAIALDLYEGPHAATQRRADPIYGSTALQRTRAVLAQGGVLGIWSEEAECGFEERLEKSGFRVQIMRSGKGGRRHVVYLAVGA